MPRAVVGPDSAVAACPRHVRCTLNICRDVAVPRTERCANSSHWPGRLIERQRCSILLVANARQIIAGIDVSCPTEEELLNRFESARTQRINYAAKGNLHKKPLCSRDGYQLEVIWEYPCPIGNEVILRDAHVRITTSDHLGYIAMRNSDAAWKVLYLRGEEGVCRGLSDQYVDCSTVASTGPRFDDIGLRKTRAAASYIGEAVNTERIAFANKKREAAIL